MNRIFEYDKELSTFNYKISDFDIITTDNYFEAVDKTLEDIFLEMSFRNLEKIALCISGSDSEIIAQRLIKYKKNVEYFFLHIIGINDDHKIIVENIASRHKTRLNVFSIDIDIILKEFSTEFSKICHLSIANYQTLGYLIKMIPSDFYIIMGEGDLEKNDNYKYATIFYDRITDYDDSMIYVPLHLSEIAYNLTMTAYNKFGESNFYSRKFDTWYHVLRDKRLKTNFKYYYDKTAFLSEIFENKLISPIKTQNYSFRHHGEVMELIYNKSVSLAPKNWSFFIGDVVSIPKDIVF